jgi:histidine triad (HIT) family protein
VPGRAQIARALVCWHRSGRAESCEVNMHTSSCIFCRIAAGEVPCHRVFEDRDTLAFLDIGPLADGHLLVIPKAHYERLDNMPAELAGRVLTHLPRLAAAVVRATGAAGYNILQNNGPAAQQEVPHVHFHIIPRAPGDGRGYRWRPTQYPAGRAEALRADIGRGLGE